MPELYGLLESQGQCEGFKDVLWNMYNYTMYSLCFGAHIPVSISGRILDWVLLMDNKEHSLVVLLTCMLKICEPKIVQMEDPDERFQYISKGSFLIECFSNKAFFDELVRNYLTPHAKRVFQLDDICNESTDLAFEVIQENDDSGSSDEESKEDGSELRNTAVSIESKEDGSKLRNTAVSID